MPTRPDAGKDLRVSINTVWYCRVLLLLSFYTRTDSGIKRNDCAFVSVLWEYDKDPPGAKLCRICLNISNYSNFRCFAQNGSWCRSRIVYERRPDNQMFYVLPVESILGKLPVVPRDVIEPVKARPRFFCKESCASESDDYR